MSRLRRPVGPEDHLIGSPNAPITLVEYGDYQCPYCAAAHRQVKRLLEELGDQVAYVFRHFPLTQVHPQSMQAAEAAEAAGAQGQFWEMHDLLFDNQAALDHASLISYADALGLDVPRFLKDLREHRFESRIRRDFMDGVRSGVNGTPTFFINGVRHEGGYTFEALLDAIQGGAHSYY
jgi:protein-disulfide isomerase